jgi:hypothetical protein
VLVEGPGGLLPHVSHEVDRELGGAALMILAAIGGAVHGLWRLLLVFANYVVYGWFATCIICALTGDTARAGMRRAFGFIGKNGNKVLKEQELGSGNLDSV